MGTKMLPQWPETEFQKEERAERLSSGENRRLCGRDKFRGLT